MSLKLQVLANASQEIHDMMHHTAVDVSLRPQFCCDMDTWLRMDPIFGAEVSFPADGQCNVATVLSNVNPFFLRKDFEHIAFRSQIAPNTTCSPSREAEPFHDLRPVFNRIAAAIPAARWQFLVTQKTHIEFPAQVGSYCGDVTRHR